MSELPIKKLQKIHETKAGYPVYEFKKVEQKESSAVEVFPPKNFSRRGFLSLFSGAVSAAAIGGLPLAKVLSNHSNESKIAPSYDSQDVDTQFTVDGSSTEHVENNIEYVGSNSKYFTIEIEKYKKHYDEELPQVLEYANKVTKGDQEQRSRIQYLSEELQIENIPPLLSKELQKYIIGLCDVESSFDASKVSPSGAAGALQFMPVTWKEHTGDAENILSLVATVDAARSKFKQIYSYLIQNCTTELDVIKAEFFFGDETLFIQQFLTPVVINAYNAGEGRMKQLVQWFLNTYGTQEKTVGIFNTNEAVSGYDVFFALARQAYAENANTGYKEEASEYVLKVYGATLSLQAHVKQA